MLLPVVASMLLGGCGYVGSSPSGVTLNVPHYQQLPDSWDYCGPANVLMWRRANGHGEVSQHTIYNSMGIGGSGTNPQDLALAVQEWAHVSQATFEVAACDEGPYDERDIISARQITSIDNGVPIIVIVDGGFHDQGAVGNTGYNLNEFGDQVVAYGYDGPRPGGDPIPK